MAFHSLRARLLVVQSGLVVGLTVATLAYVSARANRFVSDRISVDLTRSRDTIRAAEADRLGRLGLVAQLVSWFPELRALFANTDSATIREFLIGFRQQHDLTELLVALDASGRVLARSDSFAQLAIPRIQQAWIEPLLNGKPSSGYLEVDGRPYHGVLAAAESGGTIFGFVLAAAPIDDRWAHALREASDKEIVILTPRGVAGTTVPSQRLPWRTAADLSVYDAGGRPHQIDLGGEQFLSLLVSSPESELKVVSVLSLQSRDIALAPYRKLQLGLLVLGLAAAALGIGGSALFARSLTAPIGQLLNATRQVSAGSYDVPLSTAREDEIGDLSRAFKKMTEGLRERADMLKFVSHSTAEMIQSQKTPERQLGERREITLLFCDIRGFTSFAEQRAPEEAVAVLNRYLHLQADLVKQYHGDVDKFIGDAVFAHFTGPDMALDAIRCGVEIQRAVASAGLKHPDLPKLDVGVGIATGEVIVGSIGSDDRLDYTAIGSAVNLSARLCAACDAHEILMSERTFEKVRDLIAAEPVAPMTVKGFSGPVHAYRMVVRQPA
ncbi:MAG TPA: adenylate/guanylate cyclase domain-containing protein [Vicinamibacterales bacterium]|jgi:class 3 adenylate cyclase|nr:adenylate/guanylate cyclase domain-containing protein [Vicinamibacterales bacterium]